MCHSCQEKICRYYSQFKEGEHINYNYSVLDPYYQIRGRKVTCHSLVLPRESLLIKSFEKVLKCVLKHNPQEVAISGGMEGHRVAIEIATVQEI